MTVKSFLKFVEIRTKVASIIPFSLGTIYAFYRYNSFNLKNFLLMLISLLAFDMTTTGINNFFDYKRAKKTYGYNYESHNAIVRYGISKKTVLSTLFLLFFIAAAFGILLFISTNVVVLLIGGISFMVGIFYTFGPVSINRTPLGEVFSGFFMGFIITFLAVYIHNQDSITLLFSNEVIHLSLNVKDIIFILLVSIPPMSSIANIMLANNICDIDDDLENKRYTLPIYIGKTNALKLYKALYYIGYLAIIISILAGILSFISLIVIVTFIPVKENIETFYEKQSKKDTFVLSVQNFILINGVFIASIGLALLISAFI